MSQKITFNATVSRIKDENYKKDKTIIKYETLEFKKRKEELFDPVYTEAEALYKDEKFEGKLPQVSFMVKDANITNFNPIKGYIVQDGMDSSSIEDKFDRESNLDKEKKIFRHGLALIANRNMVAARFFSYPKTFLIYDGEGPQKEMPNLQNYQRVIILSNKYDDEALVHYAIISVVDISPFIYDFKIRYKQFNFYLLSSNDTHRRVSLIPLNAKIKLQSFKLPENHKLEKIDEIDEKSYLATNFLTTFDNSYSGSETEVFGKALFRTDNSYLRPTNELYFAALYLVDYYSRNLESPAYLEKDGSHDALVYICRNADKIKTVWNAAMHLGTLVTHAPVNSYQHQLPVPSDVFDEEKVKMINKLFVEKTK